VFDVQRCHGSTVRTPWPPAHPRSLGLSPGPRVR
jgi:hypothetical protein